MDAAAQEVFDFCRQRPARAKKPDGLFFALMPNEASCYALTEFAERFVIASELEAERLKPSRFFIALQSLSDRKGPVLYGAKLAGQAVAAAGLTMKFDTVVTVYAGRRVLALSSGDKVLATVTQQLDAAIARQGLKAESAPPFLGFAYASARLSPQKIKPLKISVTGLALLRGECCGDFQVLRRWPLNRST